MQDSDADELIEDASSGDAAEGVQEDAGEGPPDSVSGGAFGRIL